MKKARFIRPTFIEAGAAMLALIAGVMVYMLTRPENSVLFLSWLPLHIHPVLSTLGDYTGSLPSFFHIYGFIILTYLFTRRTLWSLRFVTIFWLTIELLFESLQKLDSGDIMSQSTESAPSPGFFSNYLSGYFINGTYDSRDIAALLAGAFLAYITVLIMEKKTGSENNYF